MVIIGTNRYGFSAFLKHFLGYGMILFVLFFAIFNAGAVQDEIMYRFAGKPVWGSDGLNSRKINSENITNPFPQAEASIVIPAINISAPIIFPAQGSSNDVILKDLESGVAHYPDSVDFGQRGTSIIVGHSSSPRNYVGNFAHVFSRLDKLSSEGGSASGGNSGDKIYVFYKSKTLIYKIYQVKIIDPADFQNEIAGWRVNSQLVLMSCWPVGTNWNRVAVFADLIN